VQHNLILDGEGRREAVGLVAWSGWVEGDLILSDLNPPWYQIEKETGLFKTLH
jgi:hypothetical protein